MPTIDAAITQTRAVLEAFPVERRRQAQADVFRLLLSTMLQDVSGGHDAEVQLATRNSVSLLLEPDGTVLVRVLKSDDGGSHTPSSDARSRELIGQDSLDLGVVPSRITLHLLWTTVPDGVRLELVLPKSNGERCRYVDEHWRIDVPDAVTVATRTLSIPPQAEEPDLDDYRKIDQGTADGDGGDEPA